jgi:hypothetical protein
MRLPAEVLLEGGGLFVGTSEGGRVSIVPFIKGGDAERGTRIAVGGPLYGTGATISRLIEALEAAVSETNSNDSRRE